MKTLIGFLILINTTFAMASLDGNWRGWGTWSYEGSGAPCDMNISFSVQKDSFRRDRGYFDCTVVGLDLPPVNFTKKGESLYDGEILVGKITENSLELTESYDENVTIKTTILVDGHHFDYKEVWTEKNGSQIYLITGRLFLRNNL